MTSTTDRKHRGGAKTLALISVLFCLILCAAWLTGCGCGKDEIPEGYIGIYGVEDFALIGENPDKNYYLACDLDLRGGSLVPIGKADAPFTGVFNGGGHTIRALNLTPADGAGAVGLFAYSRGIISDLTLSDVSVSYTAPGDGRSYYFGCLVGYGTGTLRNCSVSGTLTLSLGASEEYGSNYLRAGGLIGYNGYGGALTGCKTDLTCLMQTAQTAGNGYLLYGGIAGENSGRISLCESAGSMTFDARSSGAGAAVVAGGIVGENLENSIVLLSRSSAALQNTIIAQYDGSAMLGGLVGMSSGNMAACAAEGRIESEIQALASAEANIGGLIGHSEVGVLLHCTERTVLASRANATAASASCVGTLVGYNKGGVYSCLSEGSATSSSINSDYAFAECGIGNGVAAIDCYRTPASPMSGEDTLPALAAGSLNDAWLADAFGFDGECFRADGSTVSLLSMGDLVSFETTARPIGSREEFERLARGTVRNLRLACDLDFAGSEIASCPFFFGTLQGDGHSLRNFTVRQTVSGSAYAGLFDYVYGYIKNLRLENGRVEGGDGVYAGGLCGGLYGGGISECTLTGMTVSGAGAGGLVGYLHARVGGCHVAADVNATLEAGGVAAYVTSYGSIASTATDGRVILAGSTADNAATVMAGGIAGYCAGILSQNRSSSALSAQGRIVYAGGIAGYTNGATVSDCINEGSVTVGTPDSRVVSACVGGIVGNSNERTTVSLGENRGAVSVCGTGYIYAGGICGYQSYIVETSFTTPTSSVVTDVKMPAGAEEGAESIAASGGICGKNEGVLRDCHAAGTVSAANNTLPADIPSGDEDDVICYAFAGGIAAQSDNIIGKCYTTASVAAAIVAAQRSEVCAGGAVGQFSANLDYSAAANLLLLSPVTVTAPAELPENRLRAGMVCGRLDYRLGDDWRARIVNCYVTEEAFCTLNGTLSDRQKDNCAAVLTYCLFEDLDAGFYGEEGLGLGSYLPPEERGEDDAGRVWFIPETGLPTLREGSGQS